MYARHSLQHISDEIVSLASQIIGMSQRLKNRALSEFVRGTPQRRAAIAEALGLTDDQVQGLIAAEPEPGALGAAAEAAKQPQLWDYDTKTATLEDLTRRRNLLRNRLSVLEYLRAH